MDAGVVQDFAEKPSQEVIESGNWGTGSDGEGEASFEASMGIYCFKRTALEALLTTGSANAVNFGSVSPVPLCPVPCAPCSTLVQCALRRQQRFAVGWLEADGCDFVGEFYGWRV